MDKIDKAARELGEMDELAAMASPIHALHPLAKLSVTLAYIFTVVSYDRYELSRLWILLLYPALLYQLSGIPMSVCFRKLRAVLPLVCAVGIVNPFLDRAVLFTLWGVPVSGGMISMLTLMLKGVLCLLCSFLMAATTGMAPLCAALRKLRVPKMPVTLLLLTYRYAGVMLEELSVMNTAYMLRAPGQRGIHYSAWGSFLGQLLLRTMDRGAELYNAMQLRGFDGNFSYADCGRAGAGDWVFVMLSAAFLFLCRRYNVTELLGVMMMGGRR